MNEIVSKDALNLVAAPLAALLAPALEEEVKTGCRPLYTAAKLIESYASLEKLVPGYAALISNGAKPSAKPAWSPAVPEFVVKNALEAVNSSFPYLQGLYDLAVREEEKGVPFRTADLGLARKLMAAQAAVAEACEVLAEERLVGPAHGEESRTR